MGPEIWIISNFRAVLIGPGFVVMYLKGSQAPVRFISGVSF
jgi:hypothetical protein